MSDVTYSQFETPIGLIWIASSEAGVCYLALPNQGRETFLARLQKAWPDSLLAESLERNSNPAEEVLAYFAGEVRAFESPLDVRAGTPFQQDVWRAVAAIPYGETCSYGDIARTIGRPRSFRAVGAANGANPLPIFVPCHRVIGSDGSLTGYGGGMALKQWLLENEKAVCQNRLPNF